MRIRGLYLFSKTNGRRDWTLAAWHSPHSLTWRWSLSFGLGFHWRVWRLWYSYRTNNGLQWGILVPFLGTVRFNRQRPMWYRDLYIRLRDEADQRSGMAWFSDDHPHKLHEVKPPIPTVIIDGPATIQ